MTGLDTNILIRYFVRDDPAQTQQAMTIIDNQLSPANPGFISTVTMVELTWVLKRSYKLPTTPIAEVIFTLLSDNAFRVQNPLQVYTAYKAFLGGFDFADALIGALNFSAGCTKTLTFDRRAARLPGFELI